MRGHHLIYIILILALLSAGCSDVTGDDTTPSPTTTPAEPRYVAGDIVAKTATQAAPLWLVIRYDKSTDKYERALIYKKSDGTWGVRRDSSSEYSDRATMEKVYVVRVAHVTASAVPIVTPTGSVTATTPVPTGEMPEITSITPNSGASGTIVLITNLAGKHFQPGATVKLVGASSLPIDAGQVQAIDTKITCFIDLTDAPEGKYDLIVTNPDGLSDTLSDGFTVNAAPPVILGINPYRAFIGESTPLTITGRNFKDPAKVYFTRNGPEIEGGNVIVKSANEITLVLAIPSGTLAGEWDVIVRNVVDRQNSTALKKFTISNSS